MSSEASSLAGTQRLGNLVLLYDDNHISIEDDTDDRPLRGRLRALRGLRLARPARRLARRRRQVRRERRGARPGLRRRAGRDRAALVHRAAHGHRLAGAQRAEHRQGARQRPRRRRGRRDEGDPRLRPGEDLRRRPDDVLAHARSRRRPRPGGARRVADSPSTHGRRATPRARRCSTGCPTGGCQTGWTDALPEFPADAKGMATRKASGTVLGKIAPVLPELWGGSADLAESNNTTPEGEPSFLPEDRQSKTFHRRAVRPRAALRHPRARHGLDHERHRAARRHPRLRRHVPGLQRLHAPGRAARRADEAAGDLRLDARLDRPGRGRADPPAGRAPGRAAGHPRSRRRPPGRRQRDRRRVAHHPRPHRPARRPVPDPAGRADVRPVGPRLRRGHRPRRLRPRRRLRRTAPGRARRDRLRGAARRRRPRGPRGGGHADPRRVDAVPRVVPRAGHGLPAAGDPAGRARPGSASRPRWAWAGATSSATPARS